MFARATRIAQFAELCLWLALAAWLHAARGWSLPAVAVLVVAIVLAVRMAIVLSSFTVAWLCRSERRPEHRIGFGRTLAMLAGEFRAVLMFNLVQSPWEAQVLRPDPPAAPATTPPIILVHGYMANRGYFRPLVDRLEAAGLGPVFVPNFTTFFATIEHFAEEIHREVERIAAGTGQEKVILVVHSMGGLGARQYLSRHGGRRVAKLVTLCSPHQGTALAPFGSGINARQMRRGSVFLSGLADRESGVAAVPTTCIYSTHDNLVAPQEGARLPYARNVALPGWGHVDILGSAPLFAALEAELRG